MSYNTNKVDAPRLAKIAPYLKFKNNQFILTNINDVTDEELFYGKKEFDIEGHKITIDFHIDDYDLALTYTYKYLYDILLENTILLSNAVLNDIFHYELLSKDLFTIKIKNKLEDYRINKQDFIHYLKVLKLDDVPLRFQLLDLVEALNKKNVLSDFNNYEDIIEYFSNAIDYEPVVELSLVMGYPFVKNKGNKIIDLVKLLLKTYHADITIYRKGSNKTQREDYKIIEELKNLGVELKTFDHLKLFHDRYIIIKTKTRDFYFLCTCEIGNFFHPNLHEPCGSIIQIRELDLVRDNINLLDLIKKAERI